MKGHHFEGLSKNTPAGPRWTGELRFAPEKLEEPLRWKRPRRIFVNSMSDLFHEKVPDEWIDAVFNVMAACPQHTFQVLTKRAARMQAYFAQGRTPVLSNVWLGVSVEDQKTADERVPLLLDTPAAVRWVSYEPALGPVDFRKCGLWSRMDGIMTPTPPFKVGLDWIVVGGESGPGARAFDVEWARTTVAQCHAAEVRVFVKQMGAKPYQSPRNEGATGYFLGLRDKKGGDMLEWSADLRVRQFPQQGGVPA